jgi:hypothetical protein
MNTRRPSFDSVAAAALADLAIADLSVAGVA